MSQEARHLTAGHDHAAWMAAARDLVWPEGMIVDGRSVGAASGETFAHVLPRDGRTIVAAPQSDDEDLQRAVAAARRAFDDGPWPRLAPAERKRIMLRWAELIERDRDRLALMISLEMGKPISEAWEIELRAVINTYRWYAEFADKALDEVPPTGEDALAIVTREPVGVVGVVTPWNFPLTLSAWKIAPALAVGCTVVQKSSDLTPYSAIAIAELALEAGVPAGVLNVLSGTGRKVGQALGLHPAVDALAFTGSTVVGRAYQEYSARSNLKRTWLELGGKSPNVVLPDAPDLQRAIDTAAWGIYFNAGQMCTAPSRLIVHRDIADRVTEGVIAQVARRIPGDPLDPATEIGPLASTARLDAVREHVGRALADGATLACGGTPSGPPRELAGGPYLSPAVFTGVSPDSALAREEVFGPVLAVITADDEDEAVRIANDSDYGLAAGLWTANLSTAHRLSRRIRAGTVWVNCYEEGDLAVPFGGYKLSGNGRDKSAHAIDKYTELKTTYIAL